MANLKITKDIKGGRSVFVEGKEIEDVLSATIYITPGNVITANIEIDVSEAEISDK